MSRKIPRRFWKARFYIASFFLEIKRKLWCSWRDHKRCYPNDHIRWHCEDCTPCGMIFDYMFGKEPNETSNTV